MMFCKYKGYKILWDKTSYKIMWEKVTIDKGFSSIEDAKSMIDTYK